MPKQTESLAVGAEIKKYVLDNSNPIRWDQYEAADGSGNHIIPRNDDKIHTCIEKCFCKPNLNRHGVWIHNSFDCREEYQEGYRKMN